MEASGTRHASETTPTSFFKTGKDWISRAPAAAECHASPPLKGKQCCSRRTVGGYPSTTHAYRGAGGVARLWWCWRGWVRLPLPIKCRRDDANVGARCSVCGQLNREKLNFPCPRSRPRVWSCETGSAVPSRVSPLILFPPAFRHGVVSTPEKRHRDPMVKSHLLYVLVHMCCGSLCNVVVDPTLMQIKYFYEYGLDGRKDIFYII